MRYAPKQKSQASCRNQCSHKLRNPVTNEPPQREVTGQHKSKRHYWIEMRPTDMPKSIDHYGDNHTKDQPNTYMRDLPMCKRIDHDGPTSGKNQTKSAQPLCN